MVLLFLTRLPVAWGRWGAPLTMATKLIRSLSRSLLVLLLLLGPLVSTTLPLFPAASHGW